MQLPLKSGTLAFQQFTGEFFRADASDATTLETEEINGTNFVKKVSDADGGDVFLQKNSSRPLPYLRTDAINGRAALDFGTYYRNPHNGYGAVLELSEKTVVREQFYVWKDHEGTSDLSLIDGKSFLGPNPVNLRYSYRGYGGGGAGYAMFFNAAASVYTNMRIDGANVDRAFIPDDGWHWASWHGNLSAATKASDYGMYGLGYCARSSTGTGELVAGYGGVVVAEVISYTNELTDAQRLYVDSYLTQKWFGRKVAKLVVLSGATLDTSAEKLRVSQLDFRDGGVIVGDGLNFDDGLWKMPARSVSGAYAVADRSASLTPDLSFSGDAELAVAAGTGLVDKVVSATGVIRKTGDGVLKMAKPGASSLVVSDGELIVDPLATPSAYVHVDATRTDTMTFGEQSERTVITQWRDASGNARYLAQSPESFAYGTSGLTGQKKPYPYLTENFTNGLSVVDFGSFSDYGHQNGWGAEMGLKPKMSRASGATYDDDNPPVWNMIAVWGDHDEAKDLPLYNGNRFLGPCLIGNGGVWYRGYGGGGEAFNIRNRGSVNMGEDNWADGTFIPYVSWMYTYKPPARLFVQNTFVPDSQVAVQEIGGNATETTSAYAAVDSNARGVSGGLQIGELFIFRQPISNDVRRAIDNALGAKWFGRANPSAYESLSVAAAAYATFPYADVTATNLSVAGVVAARTLTAKNLTVANGTVEAALSLVDGGSLAVTASEGAFPCLAADSVTFSGKGSLQIVSDGVSSPFASPVRIIAAADGPTAMSRIFGWRGTDATTGEKLMLTRRADGYYLEHMPGMMLIIK